MKKCSMQKKIESLKKLESTNTDDEKTRVWFCYDQADTDSGEQELDGDELAVFVDDISNGMASVYSHIGQHSTADLDYIAGCYALHEPKKSDLYKELTDVIGYNLSVVDTASQRTNRYADKKPIKQPTNRPDYSSLFCFRGDFSERHLGAFLFFRQFSDRTELPFLFLKVFIKWFILLYT